MYTSFDSFKTSSQFPAFILLCEELITFQLYVMIIREHLYKIIVANRNVALLRKIGLQYVKCM